MNKRTCTDSSILVLALIGLSLLMPACISNGFPAGAARKGDSAAQTTPAPGADGGRITYYGRNKKVVRAVAAANSLLENPKFYEGIAKKGSFDHTSESAVDIASWIMNSSVGIRVKLYNGDRGSTTNAYVSTESPNTIYLNQDKLKRSVGSIAGTLIHETVHAVDRSLKNHRFGHAGNSRQGKQNSAPYWIAGLAKCMIEGGSDCGNTAKNYVDPNLTIEEAPDINEDSVID